MRRALPLITFLAVLGLVGMTLSAPAYADGPNGQSAPENANNGNGDPGKNNPGDSQEHPGNGDPGKNNPGQSREHPGNGKSDPGQSQKDPSSAASSDPDNGGGKDLASEKKDGDKGKPDNESGSGASAGGKPENDMSGKSSGPAERSPPGNNGTVKVHDQGPQVHSDVEVRRNMPHVGCTFHLYGFHFDAGQSGSWRIVHWSPGGDRETQVASGTWTASAQGDWQSGAITLFEGHFKLYFGTFDGHNKHKVFWVDGCAPPDDDEGGDEGDEEDEEDLCPDGSMKDEDGDCGRGNDDSDDDEDEENVGGADKVWVCHITGSGWVKIHIAREGWENGHSKHEGDVMAETEEGLPEDCDVDEDAGQDEDEDEEQEEDVDQDEDEDVDEDEDADRDEDEDQDGAQQNIRVETVCIANMLMTQTFVNGNLTNVTSTGQQCAVLGEQQPPQPPAPPAERGIFGGLPSSATLAAQDGRLAIAGLALLGALLLIRRRVRPVR